MRGILQLTLFAVASVAVKAQQPIGTVSIEDATVSGALEVTNGRAVLVGSSTVIAHDHPTSVALRRGGEVRVCSTSGLHLASGKNPIETMPLMLALDRGAVEIHMEAAQGDVVMTPDLRFTLRTKGPVDLRLRVAPNGDTCVENRGEKAPVLGVADQFGLATYELKPNQHVLFEHGSVKEVVDQESSPCGCPPEPIVSVADSGITSTIPALPGATVSPIAASAQHPFPAAVSAGLAPPAAVPQAPQGEVHAQVETAMTYDAADPTGSKPSADSTIASTAGTDHTSAPSARTPTSAAVKTSPAPQATETAQAPPAPPTPVPHGVFHSIGHFFRRVFTGK